MVNFFVLSLLSVVVLLPVVVRAPSPDPSTATYNVFAEPALQNALIANGGLGEASLHAVIALHNRLDLSLTPPSMSSGDDDSSSFAVVAERRRERSIDDVLFMTQLNRAAAALSSLAAINGGTGEGGEEAGNSFSSGDYMTEFDQLSESFCSTSSSLASVPSSAAAEEENVDVESILTRIIQTSSGATSVQSSIIPWSPEYLSPLSLGLPVDDASAARFAVVGPPATCLTPHQSSFLENPPQQIRDHLSGTHFWSLLSTVSIDVDGRYYAQFQAGNGHWISTRAAAVDGSRRRRINQISAPDLTRVRRALYVKEPVLPIPKNGVELPSTEPTRKQGNEGDLTPAPKQQSLMLSEVPSVSDVATTAEPTTESSGGMGVAISSPQGPRRRQRINYVELPSAEPTRKRANEGNLTPAPKQQSLMLSSVPSVSAVATTAEPTIESSGGIGAVAISSPQGPRRLRHIVPVHTTAPPIPILPSLRSDETTLVPSDIATTELSDDDGRPTKAPRNR